LGEARLQEHHLSVTRTARYFTLGTIGPGEGEVWFVLHGYGQLAGRFLRHFEPLAQAGALVVAPEGLSRFYVDDVPPPPERKVGASWMTREDRLGEIEDYVRYLDAVYEEVFRGVKRPAVRVTVLAFSQGTATACRWLARGVARADRLILWGGDVPPDLDLAGARSRLAPLALTLVVGRRDEYITAKLLARETARLTAHGIPFRIVQFDGGHEIEPQVLLELAARREG